MESGEGRGLPKNVTVNIAPTKEKKEKEDAKS